MIEVFWLLFVTSLLFFIGAYFPATGETSSTKGKGTIIKAFLYIGAAAFMYLAVTIAILPQPTQTTTLNQVNVTTITQNVPLNCVYNVGNAIVTLPNPIPCGTTTEVTSSNTFTYNTTITENPFPNTQTGGLTSSNLWWFLYVYDAVCLIFALFAILTGGANAGQEGPG